MIIIVKFVILPALKGAQAALPATRLATAKSRMAQLAPPVVNAFLLIALTVLAVILLVQVAHAEDATVILMPVPEPAAILRQL